MRTRQKTVDLDAYKRLIYYQRNEFVAMSIGFNNFDAINQTLRILWSRANPSRSATRT